MNHYVIPNTDLSVSRLAYGTMRLGSGWSDEARGADARALSRSLVEAALEHGVNHLDLADIYNRGDSDKAVGYALKENPGLRDKLVLQEKVGILVGSDPAHGEPSRYDYSYEHLITAVEGCLKRLGTDRVDLLAFHRPDILVEPEEVARAAQHLHREGMVRYFGVSNHSPLQIELLKRYLDVPLVVNQLQLSLLHHGLISAGITLNQSAAHYTNTQETLEYCRLNGVMVQAWSPVAGGALFTPAEDAPEHVRKAAALLSTLAADKDVPAEAVALAWLLRHPAGIQPIVGTTKLERLAASVKADEVELSRPEWYSLLAAARGAGVP